MRLTRANFSLFVSDDLTSTNEAVNSYIRGLMQNWTQADGDPAHYVAAKFRRDGFTVDDIPESVAEFSESDEEFSESDEIPDTPG